MRRNEMEREIKRLKERLDEIETKANENRWMLFHVVDHIGLVVEISKGTHITVRKKKS